MAISHPNYTWLCALISSAPSFFNFSFSLKNLYASPNEPLYDVRLHSYYKSCLKNGVSVKYQNTATALFKAAYIVSGVILTYYIYEEVISRNDLMEQDRPNHCQEPHSDQIKSLTFTCSNWDFKYNRHKEKVLADLSMSFLFFINLYYAFDLVNCFPTLEHFKTTLP